MLGDLIGKYVVVRTGERQGEVHAALCSELMKLPDWSNATLYNSPALAILKAAEDRIREVGTCVKCGTAEPIA